ncbi:hypothetical protein BGZ90_003274, partial [Linnemannia elongata]
MLQNDVQDLQVDCLNISDSLDSPGTSRSESTILIEASLDPMEQDTIVNAEGTSLQEKVMETPPESLHEQRNITDATSTTQSLVLDLHDAALYTNSIIDAHSSNEPAQQAEELLHNDTPAVSELKTPTSSNDDIELQSAVVQESRPIISTDFTLTSINANLGDKDAQVALGDMYLDGEGVQQDYQAAMKWFRRAADQGYAI